MGLIVARLVPLPATPSVNVVAPHATAKLPAAKFTLSLKDTVRLAVGSTFTAVSAGTVAVIVGGWSTLIVNVSVSVCAPPDPVLPRSEVAMVTRIAAVVFGAVYVMPFNAVLTTATVPVTCTLFVPEPVTVAAEAAGTKLPLPAGTLIVTCTLPAPASTSATLGALAAESASVPDAATCCVAGTVLTGASLTAVTVIVNDCAPDVSTPPFAVPPLSWATSVIVATPLAFAAGV